MKKHIINYKINGKQLMISTLDSIQRIEFPYEIDEVEKFENSLVVLLDIPMGIIFNENVFGVSAEGKVIWKIEKMSYVYDDSPFTGMGKEGNYVKLSNWGDIDLLVNPNTGEIVKKSFSK
jgi:hypothetical protein